MFRPKIRFGCNQCGECCRQMRVPLSHADILRIAGAYPERPPSSWITVYPADPAQSSAVLIEGKASLLLLRVQMPEQACVFLQDDGGCGIYPVRPRVCRIWPFEKGERHLRVAPSHQLLTRVACDEDPFKGQREILREIEFNALEFKRSGDLIQQWNYEMKNRPQAQSLSAFIDFIQECEPTISKSTPGL